MWAIVITFRPSSVVRPSTFHILIGVPWKHKVSESKGKYRQKEKLIEVGLGRVIVLNTTFNNISVISWQSVLSLEETGVPGENHWPAASQWQTLWHKSCIEYTSTWAGFEVYPTHNFSVKSSVKMHNHKCVRVRPGRDRMVVGFTTTRTCAISAYRH
jgi:hypothetical protein